MLKPEPQYILDMVERAFAPAPAGDRGVRVATDFVLKLTPQEKAALDLQRQAVAARLFADG